MDEMYKTFQKLSSIELVTFIFSVQYCFNDAYTIFTAKIYYKKKLSRKGDNIYSL